MKAWPAVMTALLLGAPWTGAQETDSRAWQQRLAVAIPAPVPMVGLETVNPFAADLDVEPELLAARPPDRMDLRVAAAAAVYVDADGECLGAVPLELPFPGVAAELVAELAGSRFEPARTGQQAQPSWPVVEIWLEGRVKSGTVLDLRLEPPDPATPPQPSPPTRIAPPGNVGGLPAVEAARWTTPPVPKRVRVRLGDRETEVSLRALLRIEADGTCSRFVPLDVPAGLRSWLGAYLASWRLDPGRGASGTVAAWTTLTARVRFELSKFRSEAVRVARDRSYDPTGDRG